jgi:hypothetical protein
MSPARDFLECLEPVVGPGGLRAGSTFALAALPPVAGGAPLAGHEAGVWRHCALWKAGHCATGCWEGGCWDSAKVPLRLSLAVVPASWIVLGHDFGMPS